MSLLEKLTEADIRLAAQVDAVASMLDGVGSRTAAARERLTEALAGARARLAGELFAMRDAVDKLAGDFQEAVDCGLLALPEPAPDVVVPATEPMPTCSYCSCDAPEGLTDGLCAPCRASLDGQTSTDPEEQLMPEEIDNDGKATDEWASRVGRDALVAPVNRVAELVAVAPIEEASADELLADMASQDAEASARLTNGRKPRKRR